MSRSLGASLGTTSSAATQSSSKAGPFSGGGLFAGMSQAQASHNAGIINITSSPPSSPPPRKTGSSSGDGSLVGMFVAQASKNICRIDTDIWADLPTSNQPGKASQSSAGSLLGDMARTPSSQAPKSATPSTSSQTRRSAPDILLQAKAFQNTDQGATLIAQRPPGNNG
jgi:hypothetical protein